MYSTLRNVKLSPKLSKCKAPVSGEKIIVETAPKYDGRPKQGEEQVAKLSRAYEQLLPFALLNTLHLKKLVRS